MFENCSTVLVEELRIDVAKAEAASCPVDTLERTVISNNSNWFQNAIITVSTKELWKSVQPVIMIVERGTNKFNEHRKPSLHE